MLHKLQSLLVSLSEVSAVCLENTASSLGLMVVHAGEWAELKLTGILYSFVILPLSA